MRYRSVLSLFILIAALLIPTQASAQELLRQPAQRTTLEIPNNLSSFSTLRLSEPLVYFGLGDSFASGEGNNANNYDPATDTATNECHRAYDSYAELITANSSMIQSLEFVACSGAKIDDVRTLGQYGEPAQLDVFGAASNTTAGRIITISIGGNDVGFVPTLTACATTTDCHLDPTITGPVNTAIANIRPDLEHLYTEIMNDPANASQFTSLVVVGYPRLFGSGTCPTTPIDLNALYTADERAWMDQRAILLNREIKKAVDAVATAGNRVFMAPMVRLFNTHEACGTSAAPKWINPLDITEFEHSFHPNELGHDAMAANIEAVIRDRVLRYV